ncbi:inhibitor of nuclear factor kappa-B kinase-interacting protein isoform X2 [Heteronotia binoei]|uniref:inhibitor of nuclear factor kappa-B kinase-interacting protein isoform X2 n=1 Tax=Heteronotia binoei TaxID=13085 RepID=UPI0029313012|nr:inhibitor of nuclear factor kappa-B kinase-interacting protein isoform X2 [Heteronotia binoei]
MSEIKQRRKTISVKPNEDQQKLDKQSDLESTHSPRSFWADALTAASCLSLTACVSLTWFLFQQSAQLAAVEEKYHLLTQEAMMFQDMENKIELMSTKLESSLEVLQEASASVSVMTKLEQEVASLRNILPDILNSKQTLSEKFNRVNEKFQNVTVSWKRSLDEMNTNTSSLRSEAKFLHNEVTSQINAVDSKIKSLSERLTDLEDSTIRNVKMLNRQEEADLSKIEQRLQADAESANEVAEKWNNLLARNSDLRQKLADYEPKVEECKAHLPVIESAVYSVVKLSSDLIGIGKMMEDMSVKVFNAEDEMVKAKLEIMNIQKALEGIQYKNS